MRTPALLLIALLGALRVGSPVLSQIPANGGTQLQGTVLDADTGRPLAKVGIRIGEKSVTTDAAGRFTVAGLSAGRQRLTASRVGYILSGLRDPKTDPRPVYRQEGVYLTLSPDATLQIALYMLPSPFVTGVVLDSFGQPVLGAMVTAHRVVYDAEGNRTLNRRLVGETDDRGAFETESLSPGEYVFRAEKTRPETDPREQFIAARYPAYSDPSRPETTLVKPGETTRLPQIVLSSAPAVRVQVRLVNQTGIETPGYVALRRKDDLGYLFQVTSPSMSVKLPQGSYDVEVGIATFRDSAVSPAIGGAAVSRGTIDVRDKDVDFPLALSAGTRVDGRVVRIEKNGEMTPVRGAQVRLGSDVFLYPVSPISASSGGEGTFKISSVPEGSYRLRVPLYGEDAGLDSIRDPDLLSGPRDVCFGELRQNDAPVAGHQIKIGGESTAITVILRDSSTRIQGKVVDSQGRVASSAIVALVPDDRRQIRNYAAMTADQNGDFEFTCAPAGNYRIFAWTDLSGAAYRNEEFMAKYNDRGTAVRLADGDSLAVKTEVIEP